MKNLLYMYTMEYYSDDIINVLFMENIILSKASQRGRATEKELSYRQDKNFNPR